MTELTIYSEVFTDLTPAEEQTVKEEWQIIGAAVKRKIEGISDNLILAQSLTRIRKKHSVNSKLYRTFLDWLGSKDAAWQDRNARQRFLDAYKGQQVITACGSEDEQEKSISKYDSLSALAEARKCPDKHKLDLASKLQKRKEKVTAEDQRYFNKHGSFPKQDQQISCSNSSSQTKPKTLSINLTGLQRRSLEDARDCLKHSSDVFSRLLAEIDKMLEADNAN